MTRVLKNQKEELKIDLKEYEYWYLGEEVKKW